MDMLNFKSVILAGVLSLGLVSGANAGTWSAPTQVTPSVLGLHSDYVSAIDMAANGAIAQGYIYSYAQVVGSPCNYGIDADHKYYVIGNVMRDPRIPHPWRTYAAKFYQVCNP
jgi:hypothetical protein